jgi:electron transfer flavoprotein alpha subunit
MKILVFIKQVPEVSDIKFDPETKTLIREGVKNGINAYDRRAISEAIRQKNEKGGEAVIATMGPPQAKDALVEALLMGADRAVHIMDRRLAGSDTLVTAKVLAAAARKIGFDLIFSGQHSTDSETAQVPVELAELLQIPCATAVNKIEWNEDRIRANAETDEGIMVLDIPVPCVISAAERLIKPLKARETPLTDVEAEKIQVMQLEDLGIDPEMVGLKGSPTWVEEIHEKVISRKPQVLSFPEPRSAAESILNAIREASAKPELPVVPTVTETDGGKEIWCFMEHFKGGVRPVCLEMLSTAATLASDMGGTVCAISTEPEITETYVASLSSSGANKIYHMKDLHPDQTVALVCKQIQKVNPYALLLPSTAQGKYLAPRIAARMSLGLTGDCVGLELDHHGRLAQLKPAFGGNIVASIFSRTFPQMATIRPGALPNYQPRGASEIPVEKWEQDHGVEESYKIVWHKPDIGLEAAALEYSDVVICVGMGLGQDNVALAFHLAEHLHGAFGATRRVVDSGWLPRQFQIGLTGKFVAPRVYLGLGVGGRFNHTIGIQKASKIIAINNDPKADIFKTCDIGIVGDCVAISQELIELAKAQR